MSGPSESLSQDRSCPARWAGPGDAWEPSGLLGKTHKRSRLPRGAPWSFRKLTGQWWPAGWAARDFSTAPQVHSQRAHVSGCRNNDVTAITSAGLSAQHPEEQRSWWTHKKVASCRQR